jgi:polysaccharide export outer membrane protein
VRCLIAIAAIVPLVTVGCAGVRSAGTLGHGAMPVAEPTAAYRIGCPDVLAVRFADQPHLDCVVAVDLDGRLPLSETALPHVEGGTLEDARRSVASTVGCDENRVVVRLADARTGRLYVFGPEQNRHRVVPYVGPERLTDFLVRTDSLRHGCTDLRDVFVLRPNVAAGQLPQVFRADLRAVRNGDSATNVLLESGDQVYVGETRRSSFARLLPGWMRSAYLRIAGLTGGPRRE